MLVTGLHAGVSRVLLRIPVADRMIICIVDTHALLMVQRHVLRLGLIMLRLVWLLMVKILLFAWQVILVRLHRERVGGRVCTVPRYVGSRVDDARPAILIWIVEP